MPRAYPLLQITLMAALLLAALMLKPPVPAALSGPWPAAPATASAD